MRRRRGLTLLEILIVLALLIATAALAIPAMTHRFESTRFEATVDQIIATLALARAESQQQRRPVQILWDAGERVVRGAWLDTELLAGDDEQSRPVDDSQAGGTDADGEEADPQSRLDAAGAGARTLATGGSRLRVLLPEGCRVEPGRSESPEAGATEPSPDKRADPPGGDSTAPISLVVYMPDGSTFGEASFRVVDDQGRQVRIEINPWTGQALVSQTPAAATSEPPASELDPSTTEAQP